MVSGTDQAASGRVRKGFWNMDIDRGVHTLVDSVIGGSLEAVAGLGVLAQLVLGRVDNGVHGWYGVEDVLEMIGFLFF